MDRPSVQRSPDALPAEAARNLKSGNERADHLIGRRIAIEADGENGRPRRRTQMRGGAVVDVIEIEAMGHGAVHQRRRRRKSLSPADQRSAPLPMPASDHRRGGAGRTLGSASDRHAEPIDKAHQRGLRHLIRQTATAHLDGELARGIAVREHFSPFLQSLGSGLHLAVTVQA